MNDPKESAVEFDRHTGRRDGLQVVASLNGGLGLLSDLLYVRMHEDVEKAIGADSMLVPVSEMKSLWNTKIEIALYQIAESAAMIRQCGYLPDGDEWFVPWLAGRRLGGTVLDAKQRGQIERYLSLADQTRRLAMTDVLASVLPESRRAPLVLFQLFPLAVRITTALAFGDRPGAERHRAEQVGLLPIIASCQECHGRLLDNGESCPSCANPLWKTQWLISDE
jgi:hypothetical protein